MDWMRSNPPWEMSLLGRPRVIQLVFRLLADEFRRDFAEGLDIGSPVMDAEEFLRDPGEHASELIGAHGSVGADGRKDCFEFVAVVLKDMARELAGAGVFAALVGGHGENAAARAQSGEGLIEQFLQLLWGDVGIDAADGAEKAHAAACTFLRPGARRRMMARATM